MSCINEMYRTLIYSVRYNTTGIFVVRIPNLIICILLVTKQVSVYSIQIRLIVVSKIVVFNAKPKTPDVKLNNEYTTCKCILLFIQLILAESNLKCNTNRVRGFLVDSNNTIDKRKCQSNARHSNWMRAYQLFIYKKLYQHSRATNIGVYTAQTMCEPEQLPEAERVLALYSMKGIRKGWWRTSTTSCMFC